MFELICMSLLGVAYVNACIEEAKEEQALKEKERTRDLKISVFCYAVRHGLKYNEVVEMIQNNKLTFEDIEKDAKEYEGKQRATKKENHL
ncbi:MAG: hypothetical protein E7178_01560 [Erysipelotrichaceae bacterium]|nr:hypothetical protein [Erysipelotrichaceae bacterium]